MTDIFQEGLEQIERFKEAKDENGSVSSVKAFEKGEWPTVNSEIALTQQPYIDGPADGTPHYKAAGIDQGGNEYEVKWEVRDNWEEIEDESEMVENWDEPDSITKI